MAAARVPRTVAVLAANAVLALPLALHGAVAARYWPSLPAEGRFVAGAEAVALVLLAAASAGLWLGARWAPAVEVTAAWTPVAAFLTVGVAAAAGGEGLVDAFFFPLWAVSLLAWPALAATLLLTVRRPSPSAPPASG